MQCFVDQLSFFFWPLPCLSFCHLRHLMIHLISSALCVHLSYMHVLKIPKGKSEALNGRTDNEMVKGKRTKRQTIMYIIQCIKLQIDQQEPHWKPGINSGAPEWSIVPAPLVASILLLLLQTRWYFMNEEMIALLLQQREHIRNHLIHIYYETGSQAECAKRGPGHLLFVFHFFFIFSLIIQYH